MRRPNSLLAVLLLLACCAGAGAKSRQPATAGAFYPGDPDQLRAMVKRYIESASVPKIQGRVLALIAPHAGYVYSGSVAGHAYSILQDRKIQRVIVISPCHVDRFAGAAVYDGDSYVTPMGAIPVDHAFREALVQQDGRLKLSGRGHETRTADGRGEHALEVQLPFLQQVLGDFKLVPIIMGESSYATCRALGRALARTIQGDETLIVASSDLSHFHPYDEANRLDSYLLSALRDYDYFSLHRNLEARVWEACGGGPIVATMIACEQLGASQARVLAQANSGDAVTGDRKSVVGYASAALFRSNEASVDGREYELGNAEKERLIQIARQSAEGAVRGVSYQDRPDGLPTLSAPRGAFVTLTSNGQLRGCIGYTSPIQPLRDTVRTVAAHAALHDDRFSPVSKEELPFLEYEISVLSPVRLVRDPAEILVGRHGLIIKRGEHEGLLLPQVATERGWERDTFLGQTCVKAGLPPDAWQDPGTDIFRFTALVFGAKTKTQD